MSKITRQPANRRTGYHGVGPITSRCAINLILQSLRIRWIKEHVITRRKQIGWPWGTLSVDWRRREQLYISVRRVPLENQSIPPAGLTRPNSQSEDRSRQIPTNQNPPKLNTKSQWAGRRHWMVTNERPCLLNKVFKFWLKSLWKFDHFYMQCHLKFYNPSSFSYNSIVQLRGN